MQRSPPRKTTTKEKTLLCDCVQAKEVCLKQWAFGGLQSKPLLKQGQKKARAGCAGTILLGFEYLQERRSTATWLLLVLTTLEQKGLFLIPKQISLIAACPVTFCRAHLERVWLLFLSDCSPGSAIPAPLQSGLASNCAVLHTAGPWKHNKTFNPTEENKRSIL